MRDERYYSGRVYTGVWENREGFVEEWVRGRGIIERRDSEEQCFGSASILLTVEVGCQKKSSFKQR
jgi:hypothetical protein